MPKKQVRHKQCTNKCQILNSIFITTCVKKLRSYSRFITQIPRKYQKHYDRHLFASEDVPSQLDLCEIPLSDGFQQPVFADVRLLVGCSGQRVAAAGHVGAATGLRVGVSLQNKHNTTLVRQDFSD